MKYYKIHSWQRPTQYEEVEIERETEDSVWINGYRHAKIKQTEYYFRTLSELRGFMIHRYQASIDTIKKQLDGGGRSSERGSINS